MNIDKLREYAKNKELLSYKELCEIMNWKYLTGGDGKKNQFKELSNICNYHREGRKYMIDEFCNTISQNNLSQINADIDIDNCRINPKVDLNFSARTVSRQSLLNFISSYNRIWFRLAMEVLFPINRYLSLAHYIDFLVFQI